MTREQFAAKIHWDKIAWAAGIVNVTAMLPQAYKLITTQETKGVSVGTIFIYLGIQIAFCLQGYFKRDTMLMWCLGLSAVMSAVTAALYFHYN